MTATSQHIAPLLVLTGPTAVGKTALSLDLAERFQGEIVSADSMQVYRHMDIGTAKAGSEEQGRVPHHLLDIVNPDEEYDAARYSRDARAAIEEIQARGRLPILTGGTGLYIRAVLYGLFTGVPEFPEIREWLKERLCTEGKEPLHGELTRVDPESAARIHPNDSQRILRGLEIFHGSGKTWSWFLAQEREAASLCRYPKLLQIGLTCDRQRLYTRINHRSELMFAAGLEEEVRGLLTMGYSPQLKSMQSIGYRHMNNYLSGSWSLAEAKERLATDTRHYAKRQYTWFKAVPDLHWFEIEQTGQVESAVESWINDHNSID